MTRPHEATATTWLGKPVVDRDGTELGVCAAVVSDSSGAPLWLSVERDGLMTPVPAANATESEGRVRVTASREQVLGAPTVGAAQSLSLDERSALDRHYGTTDRARSDAGFPRQSSNDQDDAQSVGSSPTVPRMAWLAGGVALLAALVAAVARLRRRRAMPPPTAAERLALQAQRASAALTDQVAQLASAAGPVGERTVRSARVGARTAAERAREVAAPAVPAVLAARHLAAQEGRRAAALAAEEGRRAASAAAGLTSTAAARVGEMTAGSALVGRHVSESVGDTLGAVDDAFTDGVERVQKSWHRTTWRLTFATSLGTGYVLGARAGRARYEQIKRAAQDAMSRPEVQQVRDRLVGASPRHG